MRLICPNCGAQYEVPVEVVPEGGRDVQCSNCGHTWFQRHPDQDRDLTEELNQPVPDTEWTPEPPAAPAVEEAQQPAPPPPPPAAQPRGLDPDMAELFREERDFEASQRAAEALESQPDLGLEEPNEDEQARRSREARERMARMRGEDPNATPPPAPAQPASQPVDRGQAVAQAAAAAAAGSRRDLLPDVEEINQTLRSSSEPRVIDTPPAEELPSVPPKQKSGFGKGLLTMMVLAGLAIGVYVFAPQISEQLPAAQPALQTYVEAVDSGRVWLDGQVTHLLSTLDGMSSEATPPTDS